MDRESFKRPGGKAGFEAFVQVIVIWGVVLAVRAPHRLEAVFL